MISYMGYWRKLKMPNLFDNNNLFDGSFYDADYYERGRTTGKSWWENYHWMPRRSFKEALAFIELLNLDETSYVLDIGCAKGFLVKALRELKINADGCDISKYALSFSPEGCWDCSSENWVIRNGLYSHAVIKDVLEHVNKEQLNVLLKQISTVAKNVACVVPMGDNGLYRIKEYHLDKSHIIAENEGWWSSKFIESGWSILTDYPHIHGIKDNWLNFANGLGNHVFVLHTFQNR